MLRPLCTANVWFPRYVASDITSLNHKDIEKIKLIKAEIRKYKANKKPCIVSTVDVVKANKEVLVLIGQGEGETRWKGCAWKLLRTKFVKIYF